MPLVEVNVGRCLTPEMIDHIVGQLPIIVSQVLSGDEQGAKLSSADIEVRVRRQNEFDLTIDRVNLLYDIGITIFANEFPSRKINLDAR